MYINEKTFLKRGMLILISETKTGIRYGSVEQKGPRPYVISNITFSSYGDFITLLPAMSKFDSQNKVRGKRKEWVECNIKEKEAFILTHLPLLIKKSIFREWMKKNLIEIHKKSIILSPKIILEINKMFKKII